jgi:hypothetical protein
MMIWRLSNFKSACKTLEKYRDASCVLEAIGIQYDWSLAPVPSLFRSELVFRFGSLL